MELIRIFNKLIAPYARRIYLMIGRGVAKLVDDSGGLQRVQVSLLDGETRSNVERFQNYGHTANPPAGAEGIIASVTGSRDHPVLIALDHPEHRLKGLKPGEGGLYDDRGQVVLLTREGIVIKTLVLDVAGVAVMSGFLKTDSHIDVGTGASGTFATFTGQVVTVQNGIIVSID